MISSVSIRMRNLPDVGKHVPVVTTKEVTPEAMVPFRVSVQLLVSCSAGMAKASEGRTKRTRVRMALVTMRLLR